ncbi:MAG: Transcriptional regulator MntR [Candidatus Heimdallarchaeota archaeon LC_3]|nr:MAG: Transcriptional regulator MntR [Candidatus Heimdallarchaeota archaeon LC_3]
MNEYRRLMSKEESLLIFLYEIRDKNNKINLKDEQKIKKRSTFFSKEAVNKMVSDTDLLRFNIENGYILEFTEKGLETAKILSNKMHRANIFKKMTSEDYLLAVYYLSKSKNSEMVTMSELAEELGLTNSAISEYIRTMAEDGTLTVQPRKGVKLTDKGLMAAIRVDNKRKILRTFFHKILKINSDLAEIEAHVLEHNTSNVLINRLEALNDQLINSKFDLKLKQDDN